MYLILWFVLSIAVALWAGKWGRDEVAWLFISLVLSPLLAGIILLAVGRSVILLEKKEIEGGRLKLCKFCAESIKAQAIICKFCGKSCDD